MLIGLDIDGVLVDFQGGWLRTYNRWFDRDLRIEDATEWGSLVDLTHFQDEGAFFDWVKDVPGFWAGLEPIPGALGGVWQLKQAGHRLEYITHRPEGAELDTYDWFGRHVPAAAYSKPHFTKDKSKIPCQLYVDDAPKVIRALRAKGLPVIRYEHPWNEGVEATGVAHSWAELVDQIGALS